MMTVDSDEPAAFQAEESSPSMPPSLDDPFRGARRHRIGTRPGILAALNLWQGSSSAGNLRRPRSG